MEPVSTIAYAVALAGQVSIQAMPIDKCDLKASEDKQTLCVLVEPPCGGDGEVICAVEESAAKKKNTTKRIYYRKNGRTYYKTVKR